MSMGYDNNSRFGGNNGQKQGPKEPTTYSELKFNNPQSAVDPTCLRFQFMYGLLSISIAPKKIENGSNNGEYVKYDYDNSTSIWISYSHAYILKSEILRLIETSDPTVLRTVGVNTKKDVLITFGYADNYETSKNYVLRITKLTPDGNIQSSYAYEFQNEMYFSIVNFDKNSKKYDKHYVPNLEVNLFITMLDEYIKSSNGAYAYMNRFYDRFTSSRKYEMIQSICEKLGIQGDRPNFSRNRNGGGFFSNGSMQNNENENVMNPPENNGFRNSSLNEIAGEYDIDD